MKAIFALILILFFAVSPAMVQAQPTDPAKQCKILNKKRLGKVKYRTSRRYRRYKKQDKDDFSLAESGTAVASNKKKSKKPSEKTESVASAGANVIIFNSMQMPSDDERDVIREEVAEAIANKADGEPIKLDPLLFRSNNGQLEIKDMRPFLTAVEFGLQGRIVLIDGHLGAKQESTERMERVRQLMINMGVEESLVSITGSQPLARTSSVPRIDFTVF